MRCRLHSGLAALPNAGQPARLSVVVGVLLWQTAASRSAVWRGCLNVRLKRGVLVAIEGIDGSGKSTQVRAVASALRAAGLCVCTTREPTRGRYGLELRRSAREGRLSPERELELFMLDRAEHVETTIRPSLESGHVVLTDRYYFSTVAYQGARGFDQEVLLRDNEAIAPTPDVFFVLDVPVGIALERIRHGREEAPNAFEQRAMLDACRSIFLALTRRATDGNVIDGLREEVVVTRDLLTHLISGALGGRIDEALSPPAASTLKANVVGAPARV